MDAFLELFGSWKLLGFSVRDLCLFSAAAVFLYRKVYQDAWIPFYEAQKHKDEMLQTAFDEVKKYQELRVHDREQSFAIQKQLTAAIDSIAARQEETIQRVQELAEQSRKYELSSMRGKLLDAYRYYANKKCNPMRAWTEMESHAFWEQFDTYIHLNENGFMRDTVEPEMTRLRVVPMDDLEEIARLMESRQTGAAGY